jgi:gamma-glutamyltranspeptidase / glutathione hydrolase
MRLTPPQWPSSWPFTAGGGPGPLGRAMVATTDRQASEVGLAVLEAGGNAADAAVAVAFALAVVNPEAGNLGGSGFLLARMADGRTEALDYRSVAPRAASAGMFLDARGDVSEHSQVGPRAAAVPGSVMGMCEAHRRLGSLPWARLVEPAIALARGFSVTERFTRSYPPHIVRGLERFPESARIFLPDGRVPRVGETLRQPDLARTLERIRDQGPEGFYGGVTADLLVQAMHRSGGILDHGDLASYAPARREPVVFGYRGHTILSMPPSSSGGVALAETAHMLAGRDLGGLDWHAAEHVHLLAETWKRAFADRNEYLADPDFGEVPVAELTSAAYGAKRALEIGARATPSSEVRPALGFPHEGDHTTHVSIVDDRGNAVAMTTTLNTWYGSKWVAEGTGVLLNNEMDDFTVKPGAPNHFGLVQGAANAVVPGKRMLSAMTPTIVLDERGAVHLVVGAPGGATIITTVFQVISNILDHGMGLKDAVAAPRVHHQHLPDRIDAEPGGLPASIVRELERLGHSVVERPEAWGDVQAVMTTEGGQLEGAADPRRGGVALGA